MAITPSATRLDLHVRLPDFLHGDHAFSYEARANASHAPLAFSARNDAPLEAAMMCHQIL